jgi:broad specificity phosphatase PhoE
MGGVHAGTDAGRPGDTGPERDRRQDRHEVLSARTETIGLTLIRTGPTEWDRSGRLTGAADVPLATGWQDALNQSMDRLRPLPTLILHAEDDASRCVAAWLEQQVRGVAPADHGGVATKEVEGLSEVGLGLWEGMLVEDAEQRYQTAYRNWRADPGSTVPPEGETLGEATGRLLGAIGKGLGRSGINEVAVVLRPLAWAAVVSATEERASSAYWGLLAANEEGAEPCPIRREVVSRSILKKPRRVTSRSTA